jgi:hypothetical protein
MNLEELVGKSISLIVWGPEKEDDVHVYLGRLHLENGYSVFINADKGWRVSLDDEQLCRLRPVPDNLKGTVLGADYALSMSMSNLPETDTEDWRPTGMNWNNME